MGWAWPRKEVGIHWERFGSYYPGYKRNPEFSKMFPGEGTFKLYDCLVFEYISCIGTFPF